MTVSESAMYRLDSVDNPIFGLACHYLCKAVATCHSISLFIELIWSFARHVCYWDQRDNDNCIENGESWEAPALSRQIWVHNQ